MRGAGAIEVAGGFVGQDERRPRDDGARDGHALLLAARELARVVLVAVGEADEAERVGNTLVAFRGGERVQEERQFHVLVRGQHRHQVVELEDVAHVRAAPRGEAVAAEVTDVLAADLDGAAGGAVDSGKEVEERGLSAAGRAHQRDEAARLDVDVDVLQGLDDFLAADVVLAEVAAFNGAHGDSLPLLGNVLPVRRMAAARGATLRERGCAHPASATFRR